MPESPMNLDMDNDVTRLRTQFKRAVFLVVWSPRIVLVCTIIVFAAWMMREHPLVYSTSLDGMMSKLDGKPITQDVVDRVRVYKSKSTPNQ